ncbi:MAG: RNA polymerase sigma factor [Planctomycetota bacterium]|jgi:RNA polymerase sigma-70 factor (ECF subfamily)|nr:RNA polymerase subunit sigma-70 [Planctomycetota bacterium]MDP6520181.1 RNA polymerase sigma factor [Planctomycetota bacterium]MDP6837817.1 RNA polymerase sigma factor [Planctomycetota bacterium]
MSSLPPEQLLERWLTLHGALIHRILRAYAFTSEDRADLLQEIALQLWDSIPRFRGAAGETTWIYRVTLYSALSWSGKERKHKLGREPLAHPPLAPDTTAKAEDPRLAWIYEQLATLDPIDRSLLLMQLDGQTYQSIATTLGFSVEKVGTRLHRLKNNLARRFEERGPKQ